MGFDVEETLRRVAVGARLVGVAWLVLLSLLTLARLAVPRPNLVLALVATVVVWGMVATLADRRWPGFVLSFPALTLDTLLAGAALVTPQLAGVPGEAFYGGFPLIVVAVAAIRAPRAAAAAAVVLSVVAVVRTGAAEGADVVDAVSSVMVYLLGALTIGWAVQVLRVADSRRRHAEVARVRAEERAEMAAHLHDSVLQTLVLIQRTADDAAQVGALARRQERELRDWLYGATTAGSGGVAEAVRRAAGDVEAHYRVRVEVVSVGDDQLDPPLEALVAAGREALVNAAKHARVEEVSVYLEVSGEQAAMYVRDRGLGFDPDSVPPGRAGLADSVFGRLRRVGGDAEVKSAPGRGTEVKMWVPR